MKSNFIYGFSIFLISILLVSIGFNVPYKLNFQSLSEKINFQGFDFYASFKALIILLFFSSVISFIPFSKKNYLNKFSKVFLILNLIFLIVCAYFLIDTTIVGSKISCEYKTPNF